MNRTVSTTRRLALMTATPLLCIWVLCGCWRASPPPPEFLVRIGDSEITVKDFKEALDIARTAYPRSPAAADGAGAMDIKLNVLNELIEELLLRLKANELGIDVGESELRTEIDAIRKDYPDDLFEREFLENVVLFNSWTKRVSARMLMEKVVRQVIHGKITISDEDITVYYREHFPGGNPDAPPSAADRDVVFRRILHEKAESAYREWIRHVYGEYEQKYGIEWNMDEWRKQLEG